MDRDHMVFESEPERPHTEGAARFRKRRELRRREDAAPGERSGKRFLADMSGFRLSRDVHGTGSFRRGASESAPPADHAISQSSQAGREIDPDATREASC